MATPAIDKIRQFLGYEFPRLGPVAFGLFNRVYRRRKITSRFFHNLTVPIDFSDIIQTAAYWRGKRYEYPTPQIISRMITEHSLTHFFDIGANFGFFSYYIKSTHEDVVVYSFEPGPKNFNKMVEVRNINRLTGFEPQNIGLGDKNEVLKFNLTIGDSGHSTFGDNPSYANDLSKVQEIQVPVRRFDDWRKERNIEANDQCKWIAKIDVEGFELKVLEGMTETLEKKTFKALCLEINSHTLNFFNVSSTQIFDFLQRFGYKAFDESMVPTKPTNQHEMRNVFFICD